MKICCIKGCDVSSEKNVSFFEFPTSRLLRKRWLDAINPTTKIDMDAVVCIRHFSTEDYEDIRGKIRLKSKVVPSVFGDEVPFSESPNTTDNDESQKRTGNCNNDSHNGKDDNASENNENDNAHNDNANENNGADHSEPEKSNKDSKDHNGHNETENGHEKSDNDTEKVHNIDEKLSNDNDKADNESDNNDKAKKLPSKKVKKKIVPFRKVGTRALNRVLRSKVRVEMSEDSSSQDSVNSSLPSEPPAKEDIEDIIANYHIENKKTERQIAAMVPEAPPEPKPLETEAVDFGMECAPVFIELSVGQDTNQPEEQPNDCLMVLESVQCEVDPTLLLEARAEDEECLEQIDLDDDDDDENSDVTIRDKTGDKKASKRPKPTADPISLLTSSDEDDVIIQEPKIDCLSVSDETDEDDVPLTRLIKTEKKAKKLEKSKKSKKKKPTLKNILVNQKDFFCIHCNRIFETANELISHKKSHKADYQENQLPITKVYQICKECGFTTSSKSQLARHQRKHATEKRYKCPLCSYKSKYNMSLMYHLKTHDFDPNMYNCGACGLELGDKKALLEHQKECYAIEEKFQCGKCGHVAKTKKQLKLHRHSIHKQK